MEDLCSKKNIEDVIIYLEGIPIVWLLINKGDTLHTGHVF